MTWPSVTIEQYNTFSSSPDGVENTLLFVGNAQNNKGKRLTRTVLIFTESSDQLSRATDRVPGLPASPG
ncbi:DUF2586 domain-containing protein, partial [Escherichia coli]|nr:DUF2586 domain-containing protein [Escherichia coli]